MIQIMDYDKWDGGSAAIADHFRTCWQDEFDHSENETYKAFLYKILESITDDSLAWIKGDDPTLLVAVKHAGETNEELVGTLVFRVPSVLLNTEGHIQSCWFWGLYVHPDYRGEGIGSQLLTAMEYELSSGQLICAVVESDKASALHFYQHNHYHQRTLDSDWQKMVRDMEEEMGVSLVVVEKHIT